jgi:hypothetical protein
VGDDGVLEVLVSYKLVFVIQVVMTQNKNQLITGGGVDIPHGLGVHVDVQGAALLMGW